MYHVYVNACGSKKRASDPLEMELWAVLSHLTLVLGFELVFWKSRKGS